MMMMMMMWILVLDVGHSCSDSIVWTCGFDPPLKSNPLRRSYRHDEFVFVLHPWKGKRELGFMMTWLGFMISKANAYACAILFFPFTTLIPDFIGAIRLCFSCQSLHEERNS